MKTETGWAIHGVCGLYVGWHSTRREMIAQHLSDLYNTPRFTIDGKLSETQADLWRRCQKNGDRAVKVRLSYQGS